MVNDFYTVKQAARLLRLTPNQVYIRIYDGKIEAAKGMDGYRIPASAIEAYKPAESVQKPVSQAVEILPAIRPDVSINVFDFGGTQVRTVLMDGEHWWIAKDVCDVLGLSNNRDALESLDEDEKNTVGISDGNRGNPNLAVINESGLYSLILRSRKPAAKAFKRWVTHEVLPTIRKTGSYNAPAQRDPLNGMVTALTNMNHVVNVITQEIALLQQGQDPDALAAQAFEKLNAHQKLLGEKRGELRILATQLAKGLMQLSEEARLSPQKLYSGIWNTVHAEVGVSRIDDYRTVEQFDTAIKCINGLMAKAGIKPKQLRMM